MSLVRATWGEEYPVLFLDDVTDAEIESVNDSVYDMPPSLVGQFRSAADALAAAQETVERWIKAQGGEIVEQ